MSYLVTTGQGRSEGLFEDLDEAHKKAEEVGGDLWVNYDLYLQEVFARNQTKELICGKNLP